MHDVEPDPGREVVGLVEGPCAEDHQKDGADVDEAELGPRPFAQEVGDPRGDDASGDGEDDRADHAGFAELSVGRLRDQGTTGGVGDEEDGGDEHDRGDDAGSGRSHQGLHGRLLHRGGWRERTVANSEVPWPGACDDGGVSRLDDYLERIGHDGPVGADLETLRQLHRRHSIAIPYEDIDVQLRVPVDLDPERIFDKLVTRRRGGWCYEMNGLFWWALREIGFDVTRMVGGVIGEVAGDLGHLGNHLVLRVDLDGRRWLVDVGLGAAMIEPIPLEPGEHEAGGRVFRLESTGNGLWRFHNAEGVNPPMFDLDEQPDEDRLALVCQTLQDDDESVFRQNLIVNRFDDSGTQTLALVGRVIFHPDGTKHTLADAEELVEVLEREFGLVQPDLHELWPGVAARHAALGLDDG